MNNLSKRYKEYWINEMEKPKTIFFSEKEIEKYVKQFPQGTKILMKQVVFACEKGHTFRQIMRLDSLDCDCEQEDVPSS